MKMYVRNPLSKEQKRERLAGCVFVIGASLFMTALIAAEVCVVVWILVGRGY